jgi:molybdenum cofactor cytidylyltransferase
VKFGPIPVEEAAGAISAHSVKLPGLVIRKGATVSPEQVEALKSAGVGTLVAVRLEAGDVGEDSAALRIAEAVAGDTVRVERPFTGRSNLYAAGAGILRIDVDAVDRINAVDESVTLATLPAFKPVVEGEMIGTVKIIPYAVPSRVVDAALGPAARGVIDVSPYRLKTVGAISTLLPGLKPSVVAKTIRALQDRLDSAGASVIADASCSHATEPLTAELRRQASSEAELIVVFGASAIADRADVIPSAIEAAGGKIDHFGMPVDPGNLLLVGRIGTKPVIGAPGCARSPAENGFDWVLQRLLAGIPVTRSDITKLGVGGLLMEIVSRGQPRAGGESADEA